MKNKTICIPIETKVRELDGKLLLASNLLEKGFDVVLGARNGVFRELKYMKNAIYLAKSISKENVEKYKQLRKDNNDLFVQNVEGGILYKDVSGHFKNSYPKELLHFLDGIILYGNELNNKFIEYNPEYDKNKLVVGGDPRFDLIKPKLNNFYKLEVEKLTKKYGDYIIINTSFSIANPFVGEKQLFNHMKKSVGYSEDVIQNLKYKNEYFKDIMHEFIKAIHFLGKKYPKLNFVIRPHPSEGLKNYEEEFKNFDNVFVTNEGNVHPWILASKGVLHYDCTTGIEAILAHKPTISFVPKKEDEIFAWLPTFVSTEVQDIDSLDSYIASIANGEFEEMNLEKEKENVLNEYIANVTKDSAKVISEYFYERYADNSDETKMYKDKELNKQRLKSSLKFLKSRIFKEYEKKISIKKFGNFNKKEVREKLTMLMEMQGLSPKIKIKMYGRNVMYITVKN
jgi:surface carbohydrate biosynthesis protein